MCSPLVVFFFTGSYGPEFVVIYAVFIGESKNRVPEVVRNFYQQHSRNFYMVRSSGAFWGAWRLCRIFYSSRIFWRQQKVYFWKVQTMEINFALRFDIVTQKLANLSSQTYFLIFMGKSVMGATSGFYCEIKPKWPAEEIDHVR